MDFHEDMSAAEIYALEKAMEQYSAMRARQGNPHHNDYYPYWQGHPNFPSHRHAQQWENTYQGLPQEPPFQEQRHYHPPVVYTEPVDHWGVST